MFASCYNLKDLDVSNWDTSKVSNMYYMFSLCKKLQDLNVLRWDTSSVTNMSSTFSHLDNMVELDLSSWNTSRVSNMQSMFEGSKIKTIYVSRIWNVSGVNNSSWMFKDCSNLVGQSGTAYDSSKVDKSMANYETGYLTYRHTPILLDYCYDDRSEAIKGGIDSSKLPHPERPGYDFVGWYHQATITPTPINKMEKFTNPNENYSWTKSLDGSWSSGNKGQSSTESKMISNKFTLDEKGVISFEWRSNGESSCDYLGYDIYDVENEKYLSGQLTPNYRNCLENLKYKSSTSYSKVTKELNPGTYQIVFMYGKDGSGNSYEDQGFVKNVYYGSEFHYEYEKPVSANELLLEGITLYAKWRKK